MQTPWPNVRSACCLNLDQMHREVRVATKGMRLTNGGSCGGGGVQCRPMCPDPQAPMANRRVLPAVLTRQLRRRMILGRMSTGTRICMCWDVTTCVLPPHAPMSVILRHTLELYSQVTQP